MHNRQNAAVERLAEKINNDFLTCKICLEQFKQPKSLSCLHTFCRSCIDKVFQANYCLKFADYRDFSCPICRKRTAIPAGGVNRLPDNFVMSELHDLVIDKTLKQKPCCEFCLLAKGLSIDATNKCLDCQKLMCTGCCTVHQGTPVSSTHSLYELEMEKDIICSGHADEPVRYYCDDCEHCICVVCSNHVHRTHHIVNLKEAAVKRRPRLFEQLGKCQGYLKTTQDCIKRLGHWQSERSRLNAEIEQAVKDFNERISTQKQDLLNHVSNEAGAMVNNMMSKKEEIESYHDQLKNTCSLTELMLSGREIELLLMMKQLSTKMDDLCHREYASIQVHSLEKPLKFVVGELHLGTVTREQSRSKTSSPCQPRTEERSTQTLPIESGCSSNHHSLLGFRDQAVTSNQTRGRSVGTDGLAADHRTHSADNDQITTSKNRRLYRILKQNCHLAVLPNTDIMVLDPDCNSMSILNKRGKIKYFLSNDANIDPKYAGVGNFHRWSFSSSGAKSVKIETAQGALELTLHRTQVTKLPVGFTAHAYNSVSSMKVDEAALDDDRAEPQQHEHHQCGNGGENLLA